MVAAGGLRDRAALQQPHIVRDRGGHAVYHNGAPPAHRGAAQGPAWRRPAVGGQAASHHHWRPRARLPSSRPGIIILGLSQPVLIPGVSQPVIIPAVFIPGRHSRRLRNLPAFSQPVFRAAAPAVFRAAVSA